MPLDDILALVANARTLSYTNSLLVALAERGVPFVVCAANHTVAGMLLSVDGHHEQARRIDGQRAAQGTFKPRNPRHTSSSDCRNAAGIRSISGH